jgi:thiol-disulfide isomerase/thioredoxin
MRQYAELLAGLEPAEMGGSTKPVGSAVGPFSATAVDGTPVDERWFTGSTLVGFFSPGCPACEQLMPDFIAAAATRRALAVVEDGTEPAEKYVRPLAETATVLAGAQAQPAVAAFGVHGFPAVCTVDQHGLVSATGTELVTGKRPVSV